MGSAWGRRGDLAVLAIFSPVVADNRACSSALSVRSTDSTEGTPALAEADRTAAQTGATGVSVCSHNRVELYREWKVQLRDRCDDAGRKRASVQRHGENIRRDSVAGSCSDSWRGFASGHSGL